MTIGRKFALPLILGFLAMFICHFGLFLCYQVGITFIAYVIVYLLVYSILVIPLTISHPRYWKTDPLLLCTIPFLYWYALLWSDGKLNLSAISLLQSTGMSVIILITFGLCVLSSFVVSRIRNRNEVAA
jgi:hypothetical protein